MKIEKYTGGQITEDLLWLYFCYVDSKIEESGLKLHYLYYCMQQHFKVFMIFYSITKL